MQQLWQRPLLYVVPIAHAVRVSELTLMLVQIESGLWLGNCGARTLAVQRGFATVVAVLDASERESFAPLPEGVDEYDISLDDTLHADLFPALRKLLVIMDRVRENGNVLVHCVAGLSRSPALVIGYLMHYHGQPFDKALAIVQTAKPDVCPNEHFIAQLRGPWPPLT